MNRKWPIFREVKERTRDIAFLRALPCLTDAELRQFARNHVNAHDWKRIAIDREIERRLNEIPTIPAPPMYRTWKCIACGGAAHPATGCVYSDTAISCWRCTKEFWAWAIVHVNKKAARRQRKSGSETSFYEAAGKWRDLP